MNILKLTIFMVAIIPTQGHASTTAGACKLVGEISAKTMKAREMGVPLTAILSKVNSLETLYNEEPWLMPYIKQVIVKAYKYPHHYTKEGKDMSRIEYPAIAITDCTRDILTLSKAARFLEELK